MSSPEATALPQGIVQDRVNTFEGSGGDANTSKVEASETLAGRTVSLVTAAHAKLWEIAAKVTSSFEGGYQTLRLFVLSADFFKWSCLLSVTVLKTSVENFNSIASTFRSGSDIFKGDVQKDLVEGRPFKVLAFTSFLTASVITAVNFLKEIGSKSLAKTAATVGKGTAIFGGVLSIVAKSACHFATLGFVFNALDAAMMIRKNKGLTTKDSKTNESKFDHKTFSQLFNAVSEVTLTALGWVSGVAPAALFSLGMIAAGTAAYNIYVS